MKKVRSILSISLLLDPKAYSHCGSEPKINANPAPESWLFCSLFFLFLCIPIFFTEKLTPLHEDFLQLRYLLFLCYLKSAFQPRQNTVPYGYCRFRIPIAVYGPNSRKSVPGTVRVKSLILD